MSAKEVECYQTVYNKLLCKINQNHSKQTHLIFTVPVIYVGNSAYNLKKCLVFIIKKMRDNGYIITYKHPNNLIVDLKNNSTNFSNNGTNTMDNSNNMVYNLLQNNNNNNNNIHTPRNTCTPPLPSHGHKKQKKKTKKYITDRSVLNILSKFSKNE